jgi:hypothetical protein
VQILLRIAGHVQLALEAAARIKVHALLAGVQGGAALWTLATRINCGR